MTTTSQKEKNQSTLEIMCEALKELGYEVNLGLVDAADFGVPQHRRRVFFCGVFVKSEFNKPTNFVFPRGNKEKKYIKDILEKDAEGYSISEYLQKSYIYKDSYMPQIVDFNSEIIAKTLCSTYHKIQRLTGTFIKDGETGLRLLTKSEQIHLWDSKATLLFQYQELKCIDNLVIQSLFLSSK